MDDPDQSAHGVLGYEPPAPPRTGVGKCVAAIVFAAVAITCGVCLMIVTVAKLLRHDNEGAFRFALFGMLLLSSGGYFGSAAIGELRARK
jgi:hypothetical protein